MVKLVLQRRNIFYSLIEVYLKYILYMNEAYYKKKNKI